METLRSGVGKRNAILVDNTHKLHTRSVTLLYGHDQIHNERSFVVSKSKTTSNADTKQTILSFKTDKSDKAVHMFFRATVTADAWFFIYEDSIVVNNTGTSSVPVYNRNRASNKTSLVWDTLKNPDGQGSVIFWDETDAASGNITLAGTQIYQEQIGSDRKNAAESRAVDEFNLKPDTVYAFVLENEGAAANIHNIILSWYEDKVFTGVSTKFS